MLWYAAVGLGAVGGLAKTLHRNDGLEYPERKKTKTGTRLDLGFMADVLLGATAALVVYLIMQQGVPVVLDVTVENANQAVAIQGALMYLLAGWSGGAFVDKQVLKGLKTGGSGDSDLAA